MKKIIFIFSIAFGAFYYNAGAGVNNNNFELKQQSGIMPGDTGKNNTNSAVAITDTSSHTQAVLDSLNNNQYSGVYYSSGNSDSQDEHVVGTREPNSYKSGRTGGQYDVVVKPGYVPMKKKNNDAE